MDVPEDFGLIIVQRAIGDVIGRGEGSVDYDRTAEFYLDVLTPGVSLVSESGHDYSDPNRRRTAVTVRSQTVPPANHPYSIITAAQPPRVKIVGGGAFVDWNGAGNILTGSFPLWTFTSSLDNSILGWEATAKDHFVADPAAITAFAFGLDECALCTKYNVAVAEVTSPPSKRPVARATLPADYVMTGGGCRVNWQRDIPAPPVTTDRLPTASEEGRVRAERGQFRSGRRHPISFPGPCQPPAIC